MTTTTATTATTANTGLSALTAGQSTTKQSKMDEASDRFLKLLVTQMQNQDPLNPMDNAQVTSQMAQINTVTGIEKLNTTVKDIGGNFTQMQMMQATNMVGHQVLVDGNQLRVNTNGTGTASFDLDANASRVTIEVSAPNGTVVDRIEKGSMTAGRQDFTWTPPDGVNKDQAFTYKVTATSGKTNVGVTTMMVDQVDAVSTTASGALNLELRNSGTLAYSKVKAVG